MDPGPLLTSGVWSQLEEFAVTKADLQGRITYANERFCRVSGHREEELLGKPHDCCLHPDSPAGMLAFMWEQVRQGQEVHAVLQSRSKHGDCYWDLTHMTPTHDLHKNVVGYHSCRRPVNQNIQRAISELYTAMREKELTGGGVQDSRRYLDEYLAQRNQTYEAFIFSLLERG